MSDMQEAVHQLNARRMGSDRFAPEDLSFAEFAQERWNVPNLAAVLNLAGVDPSTVTIQKLYSMPELPSEARWIIPEVFLEPIRTGFRKPAMWEDLTRDTVMVASPQITVPEIKIADAAMNRINEGETIPLGNIEFGGKTGRVFKIGRGVSLTDEIVMFATINILSPFLEDLGVKMGMSQSALALNTLINGEKAGNTASSAVIGVANTNEGFQYKDFLLANARFSRLGRQTTVAVVDEAAYVAIKDMQEVKGLLGNNQLLRMNSDIPDMNTLNMRVHGMMPASSIMFIDKANAMRRLMAKPLMVESEKIVSKQVNNVYATAMLGFMTFLRDARFIMDATKAYSSHGFPSYMDPTPYEAVEFAN
jgi:hypothetical protein